MFHVTVMLSEQDSQPDIFLKMRKFGGSVATITLHPILLDGDDL